ncbi:TetR/AcrR family transcriptional regulator [Paenarthrobacter sp. NPDC089714]|uniref:TetR/AcrR family transcriptional regulator n=1 Tax=Paenarthrobacter sp. NPDC089714 TaxID=3364377 RepID=UPI00382D4057
MATSHPKGLATRHRLAESMLSLIQRQGYHGTGLNSVLEESEVPKGSLYFHFPEGKAELGVAAVQLAASQFNDLLSQAVATGKSEAAVDGLVSALQDILVSSDYQAGCPVSVVALDAGAENFELRDACREAYKGWVTGVAGVLESLDLEESQAGALATSVVSMIEGALILCRTYQSTQPLDAAAATIKLLLSTSHGAKETR